MPTLIIGKACSILTITIEEIEAIIRRLPRKKGTREGISTDKVIKAVLYVIRKEFVDLY